MANFEPKKLTKENINKGQRYQNGDGVDAEAINAPIESALFVQSLTETKPQIDIDSNIQGPDIKIEYNASGLPYFRFVNIFKHVRLEYDAFVNFYATSEKAATMYLGTPTGSYIEIDTNGAIEIGTAEDVLASFSLQDVITEQKLRDRSIELIDTKEVFAETFSFNAGTTVTYLYADPNDSDDYDLYLPPENGTLATREWTEENLAPKGYRLIRDITLEEDVQQLDITTDDSGKSLNLKCVFIRFMGMFTATAGAQSFVLRFNGGSLYQMYDFYNVTADRLYAHWIKSERINTPTTDMWLSAYPFELCIPHSGELVNSQGLADMCRTVHSDISWFDGGNRSINRIGYGCASVGGANMKAGSRIVIWGIDDDE